LNSIQKNDIGIVSALPWNEIKFYLDSSYIFCYAKRSLHHGLFTRSLEF